MRLLVDLKADLQAKRRLYSQYGDTSSLLRVMLADGTSAGVLYRLQEAFMRWHLAPLALFVHWFNKVVNGCVIGVNARFGQGFVLIHPVGVVINSAVRGGANVWLESGVVIGDNRGGVPRLGDDVFVGSGAKIIGGVDVGHRSKIGANAVVLHDVAAGTTVVGIPARPVATGHSGAQPAQPMG